MSTRAQIAIQIGPEEWAHTYVHFDGYPSHMLQVRADALDCFDAPRAPIVYPEPRCDFCHTYVFKQSGWIEWRAGQ